MAFPWRTAAEVYRDRRMLIILFLGFSSGLPLPLTVGTLSIWLATAGVSKTAIGLFAIAGLPYNFKFLWAPLIDGLRIPWLATALGQRKAWALVAQVLLALAIMVFSLLEPTDRPLLLVLAAFAVAFLSASQDIVVDAYRVEILDERTQGAGAAVVQLGYRIGMLTSGAGALILAGALGWSTTFLVMAALIGVGAVAILAGPEPKARPPADEVRGPVAERFVAWAKRYVIGPFANFVQRHPYWPAILLFVALYKVSDAMMGRMTGPFYVELGFTLEEIAAVTKVFGLIATILGAMTGGIVVARIGIARGLLICGVLQMCSNLLFAGLALIGHDIRGLIVVIGLENFAEGMASAALVAYLSALCGQGFTATQYALLSSLAALPRTMLASTSGWLADHLAWVSFFVVVPLLAVPSLLILGWLMARARSSGAGDLTAQATSSTPSGSKA